MPCQRARRPVQGEVDVDDRMGLGHGKRNVKVRRGQEISEKLRKSVIVDVVSEKDYCQDAFEKRRCLHSVRWIREEEGAAALCVLGLLKGIVAIFMPLAGGFSDRPHTRPHGL